MVKLLLNGLYLVTALSGLLQFLLLPGLIWNILFPFLQVILVFVFLKYVKCKGLLKICAIVIGVLTLLDFGLLLSSNLNIKGGDFKNEIKIMSYNIYFKNSTPQKTIAVIKQENPDILMVQELTPSWSEKLNKEIGSTYPYKLIQPLTGIHGIGMYSKYPISNQKLLYNSSKLPFAQIADLTICGKTSQVINTHLASPAVAIENKEKFVELYLNNYKVRKKQLSQLNSLTTTESKKYEWQLLTGDLNTLQSEPIFKRLKFKWSNSIYHPLRWTKFNFPNWSKTKPLLTLDYILGRGKFKFLKSNVIDGGTSDHLAITAVIKVE